MPGEERATVRLRRLRRGRRTIGKGACGRGQPERHPRVDPVLAFAPDRELELAARAVEVQELAHARQRTGRRERDPAAGSLPALRVLAQPLRVQQRREAEREEEEDDAAGGGEQPHQKRK